MSLIFLCYNGFTTLSLAIFPTQSLNVIQPPNLHETCFDNFVDNKNYMALYLGQEFLEVKMVKCVFYMSLYVFKLLTPSTKDFDYEDELKYIYDLIYLVSIYILKS